MKRTSALLGILGSPMAPPPGIGQKAISKRLQSALMSSGGTVLEALVGGEGCRRPSAAFYARVGKDVLRRFVPGKSLRCAIEESAAFLIQLVGGDEKQSRFNEGTLFCISQPLPDASR